MKINYRLFQSVASSILIASCSPVATDHTAAGQFFVSHQGVGDISKSTPYDVDEIQALFPEFSVTETIKDIETEQGIFESRAINVFDGDTKIMSIYGDVNSSVTSISSKSTEVTTSEGYTIGTDLTDIFPTDAAESCTVPINYDGPKRQYLVCRHSSSRRITYLFGGSWPEDFTEMPSPEALEDATLQMIDWTIGNS